MDRNPPFTLAVRVIPERSSSKSPEKTEAIPLKRIHELESERRSCNEEAKQQRKRIRLNSSFDTAYWSARRDLTEIQLKATRLTKQISIASIKDTTRDWLDSEEGQKLTMQEKSLELDSRLCSTQAEKMSIKGDKFSLRRSFVSLFVGAETGLGIKNCRGQRDNQDQSGFRAELKLKMNSKHPDPDKDMVWCPITGLYWAAEMIVAGHLFPWKSGQDTMDAIFGRPGDGASELNRAENGILWSIGVEERFEAGHFVIVPDISDQAEQNEIDYWEASSPKEYKIRVLNPRDAKMTKKILDTEKRWADLDNQRIQFKTNFRPRARYLYFTYCEAMLRRSFAGKHLEVSRAEIGKRFWGTRGRYMREGMLLGFVEELGHEYDHLLEGVIEEEEGAVPDKTAVFAANAHMQDLLKADDESEDDDDDDDDEDEDEERDK